MDSESNAAIVAVVGTLAGVLITAAVTLISKTIDYRNQRRIENRKLVLERLEEMLHTVARFGRTCNDIERLVKGSSQHVVDNDVGVRVKVHIDDITRLESFSLFLVSRRARPALLTFFAQANTFLAQVLTDLEAGKGVSSTLQEKRVQAVAASRHAEQMLAMDIGEHLA